MGVPKFFRWVTNRYPLISSGIVANSDAMGIVIDNLYLDMNGILHACSHNEYSASFDFETVVKAIFCYLERIVGTVKPRKTLFIAVDGVAPRAKLNQQRSRRFRSSRERMQSQESLQTSEVFDSNCISPGTEFMEQIHQCLKWFIQKKISESEYWASLEIHYSGHDTPGEGEHKIISFIRGQKALPNYQPNQRHCINGQDADMIMLALATHEPFFFVIREVQEFHSRGGRSAPAHSTVPKFHFLRINNLREYLVNELSENMDPETINGERIIDDFVFLTFLVGNDFLPHLACLQIGDAAFDLIFDAYKTMMLSGEDYIVKAGVIGSSSGLQSVLSMVAAQEGELMREQETRGEKLARKQAALDAQSCRGGAGACVSASASARGMLSATAVDTDEEQEVEADILKLVTSSVRDIALASCLLETPSISTSSTTTASSSTLSLMSSSQTDTCEVDSSHGSKNNSSLSEAVVSSSTSVVISSCAGGDLIPEFSLGPDQRHCYYMNKLGIAIETPQGSEVLSHMVQSYVEGMLWCLAYYSQGCVSWTWFYPYHYGPWIADVSGIAQRLEMVTFHLDGPLLPFQQLMGCLPPSSCNLLPPCYRYLMTDASSPICSFYDENFKLDMNNKAYEWEAVVLLPFINIPDMLASESQYCCKDSFTAAEASRNKHYDSVVYRHSLHCNSQPEVSAVPGFSCYPQCTCGMFVNKAVAAVEGMQVEPQRVFPAELVSGTLQEQAGFPSLANMPLQEIARCQRKTPEEGPVRGRGGGRGRGWGGAARGAGWNSRKTPKRSQYSEPFPLEACVGDTFLPQLGVSGGNACSYVGHEFQQRVWVTPEHLRFQKYSTVQLNFDDHGAEILSRLALQLHNACAEFVGQNTIEPFHVILCSCLQDVDLSVDQIVNQIIPEIAAEFSSVHLTVRPYCSLTSRGKILVKLEDSASGDVVRLGQSISCCLPQANGWFSSDASNLMTSLGSYHGQNGAGFVGQLNHLLQALWPKGSDAWACSSLSVGNLQTGFTNIPLSKVTGEASHASI